MKFLKIYIILWIGLSGSSACCRNYSFVTDNETHLYNFTIPFLELDTSRYNVVNRIFQDVMEKCESDTVNDIYYMTLYNEGPKIMCRVIHGNRMNHGTDYEGYIIENGEKCLFKNQTDFVFPIKEEYQATGMIFYKYLGKNIYKTIPSGYKPKSFIYRITYGNRFELISSE